MDLMVLFKLLFLALREEGRKLRGLLLGYGGGSVFVLLLVVGSILAILIVKPF